MLANRGSRSVALAACAALLFTAACGTDAADNTQDVTSQQVRLYGTDGNMQNSFRDEFGEQANLLNGMKGTIPLTPLSESFKDRIRTVDPSLTDFLYSGETYDAVVISALAAELAGTTAPASIAEQINGVTTHGQRCETVASCLKHARNGVDIEYRGISLNRAGFTDAGEPSTATYATLHFNEDGRINDGKTEFVGAGDESAATAKRPRPGKKDSNNGAPLVIGGLLPKTGDLAMAYGPLAAGAALAIQEINAAGGVLGQSVVWRFGDDGTHPDKAKATVREHVDAGVHVIVGASGSGIAHAVLPDVIAAGLVLFSSSNTDAGLTTIDDRGLYFRTAPSDILQGRALADVILRDGPQKIAIVTRDDAYGVGLQTRVRDELERAGMGEDRVKLLAYTPPDGPDAAPVNFTDGAVEVKKYGPDTVLIIGFGESAQVMKALATAGLQFRH